MSALPVLSHQITLERPLDQQLVDDLLKELSKPSPDVRLVPRMLFGLVGSKMELENPCQFGRHKQEMYQAIQKVLASFTKKQDLVSELAPLLRDLQPLADDLKAKAAQEAAAAPKQERKPGT